MEKYVLLYEEFNPGAAKAKIAQSMGKIKERMGKRKESIKKSADKGDNIGVDINKTKLQIDDLDMQKQKLKSQIVNLRTSKMKEAQAKKA